jgi:hypothetical protein
MNPEEMAVYLLNNAIKQTYSLSYEMKISEAKEIALNQLAVAKMFLFDACNLDQKHCRKTLLFITEIKNELEKLNTKEQ